MKKAENERNCEKNDENERHRITIYGNIIATAYNFTLSFCECAFFYSFLSEVVVSSKIAHKTLTYRGCRDGGNGYLRAVGLTF